MTFTATLDQIVSENVNGLLGAPPGWDRTQLGGVASILNGFPFKSDNFTKGNGTPLLRIRDIVRGTTETCYDGVYDAAYLVQPGDLVVGMDGDFNCALWPGPPALLNQRVCKITTDETRYSRRFLLHVLPGYLAAINANTPSLTVKHLSSRTVADIPLPFPSLAEQVAIADEFDKQFTRLEAGVAALKRVQANLKRYRAAVLKAACEGRLVPNEAELARREGRSYEPASGLLDPVGAEEAGTAKPSRRTKQCRDNAATMPSNASPLPAGWCWASLTQLVSPRGIRTGPFGSLLKKHEHRAKGVPVLGIENVRSLRFVHGSKIHISAEKARALAAYSVEPGDILLSRSGTVGEACVVPVSVESARFSTNIIRIALKSRVADPQFLVVLFYGSPQVFDQLEALTGGSTRDFLNQRILKTLRFPLAPVDEQRRIVAEVQRRLSIADALERVIAASLHRATTLRQSVLGAVFSGRISSSEDHLVLHGPARGADISATDSMKLAKGG